MDELNLAEYTNLNAWTASLDQRIETGLLVRLERAIVAWTSAVGKKWQETDRAHGGGGGSSSSTTTTTTGGGGFGGKFGGTLEAEEKDTTASSTKEQDENEKDGDEAVEVMLATPSVLEHVDSLLRSLPETIHELGLRNQVLMLRPPVESARVTWHELLNQLISVVCSLPRIQSSRYDDAFASGSPSKQRAISMDAEDEETKARTQTYSHVLSRVRQAVLRRAYTLIESNVVEVEKYVQNWFQYQALWDMSPSVVFETLGDSVEKWQQLLRDIKSARSTFDNHETAKEFGFIVVDYGAVQQKVSDKYDAWHREMLTKFGAMLSKSMREFHATIQTARTELEVRTLDADVVELIE